MRHVLTNTICTCRCCRLLSFNVLQKVIVHCTVLQVEVREPSGRHRGQAATQGLLQVQRPQAGIDPVANALERFITVLGSCQ
jgi:hypothetical protein